MAKIEQWLAKLVVIAEQAGLDVVRQANGKPTKLRWATASTYRGIPLDKTADLVERAFGEYQALYQMGSSIAHSMSWMLDDNAHVAADGSSAVLYHSDPYAHGAAAITAIAAAESVVRDFGRYMGFDPEHALVPYRRRREALDTLINEYAVGRLGAVGHM
ncbi:hypothetical protein ACQP00_20635 [Dactylosporangium sp. CS-047395]|uniref:hypothetical protein n=1 Tax=Dactylosporangium sp. CS-047395 TaxID=3239936 RepID=UPI003D8EDAC3